MTPAEVFLRAGSALGGWFIAYGHGVMIAVIPVTQCAAREDPSEVWFASMVVSVPAIAAIWLLPAALPWRDGFRWFALPLAPLLLYNAKVVAPYFVSVTLGDQTLCSILEAAPSEAIALHSPTALWHQVWAPLQLFLIAAFAWRSWQYWRRDQ